MPKYLVEYRRKATVIDVKTMTVEAKNKASALDKVREEDEGLGSIDVNISSWQVDYDTMDYIDNEPKIEVRRI